MKKKLKITKKRAAPKKQIIAPEDAQLPPQKDEDIQLLDTDTRLLLEMAKPNAFRNELVKAKLEFIERVKEISELCRVKADLRIYFTFTDMGKKE